MIYTIISKAIIQKRKGLRKKKKGALKPYIKRKKYKNTPV
jgi:hypothetical protein